MSDKVSLPAAEWCDFLVLADPDQGLPDKLDQSALPKIVKAAEFHGLLPIVLRKLTSTADSKIALHGRGLHVPLMQKIELSTVLTMVLEHYCRALEAELQARKLRAVVVKGPAFARTIYRNANDRPFTDIDLLAYPEDVDGIAQILSKMGFNRFHKDFWDRSDTYQEQKWLLADNPNVMIELHGNLVHYPSLRRRVSFGFADYQTASRSYKDCPLALFMTAIVHASLGHKFHKLLLLVDILQAFRHLSEDHLKQLPEIARALSLRLETALCLKLITDVFAADRAEAVMRQIALPVQSSLAAALVTREILLETQGQSRLRRHVFRWLQLLHLGRQSKAG